MIILTTCLLQDLNISSSSVMTVTGEALPQEVEGGNQLIDDAAG